jgi:hypothetical protein
MGFLKKRVQSIISINQKKKKEVMLVGETCYYKQNST